MTRRSILGFAFAITLLAPAPVRAQFDIVAKAISNVESVSMFYLIAGFEPRSTVLTTASPSEAPNQTGLKGFGFELAISLGDVHPHVDTCAERNKASTLDTLEITKSVAFSGAGDSTVSLTTKTKPKAKPQCKGKATASFQLALGYSQIDGFGAQDPTFRLRGSIRELPAFAFYATYKPDETVSPYVGLRAGLTQLHSLRVYDTTGNVYTGGGDTFAAGLAAGVVADIGAVHLFIEPSYNIRRITSVEWTPISNQVPKRFPKRLDFSGWQIATGIEFELKRKTASPEASPSS